MNPDHATSSFTATARRRPWVMIAVAVLLLLVGCAGFLIVQHRRASAARIREARAIAVLHALGGEVVDRPVELFPLGSLLPGTGAAPYRLAIKLRDPGVTDDKLAILDDLDADRVSDLDLINCVAGDATLARAGRFPKLTLLGLGPARTSKDKTWPTGPTGLMTEAGFVYLDRMPDLEIVGLHGPDVTDLALARLSGARHLRILILYGSRVTGAGLAALGPKPELSTLKLGGTRFGDDDLAALAQFPSLETLDLRDTPVTDSGLPWLKVLTRLKRLSLAGCAVSSAAVDELIRARPGLAVDRAAILPFPRGTNR